MAKFWDNISQKVGEVLGELSAPDAVVLALEEGGRAMEAGDLGRAEAHFREAVAADATHGRAWQLLGLCLLGQERADEGITALQRAAELRGADSGLLATLMQAHLDAGDLSEALERGRQALRAGGSDRQLGRVLALMGRIHLGQGSHDHAVRDLRKAMALSDGVDLELAGLLGRAQAAVGDDALALHNLSRAAAASPPDARVLRLLARLELGRGRVEPARLAALRLLELDPGDGSARLLLARCHLTEKRPDAARTEILQAIEINPKNQNAHHLLGEVHAAAGDPEGAVTHLGAALALSDGEERVPLLRLRLRLALELDSAPGHLGDDARGLLALRPGDPLGLACLGLEALGCGDEALPHIEASLAANQTHAGRLVLGLHRLYEGRPAEAAPQLEAALRLAPPRGRRARLLLAQAHRARAGLEAPDVSELYPLLPRLRALLQAHPALAHLAPEVARVQEVFDRPLLVCVMGEFNSGKSTFVNALIGEEVAAMGVTPTTATINTLKYGARRQARVLWRDDHEELLAWSEVRGFLDGLSPEQAAEVRQVELLYPSEELLRVNVVDTPGLNSLVEGHEETARQVLAQADAVIWLFSAQQAGKSTEQDALELLGQHRLKTVGVLNKIDRLTDEELDQVLAHLRKNFADLVDCLIPVSTRLALRGLVGGDPGLLERSRFPELRGHLEQELFARSRQIKRQASAHRVGRLLGQAAGRLEPLAEALEDAAGAVQRQRQVLSRFALFDDVEAPRRRTRLQGELAAVYRSGTAEVLDFVRPRRWALGEHRSTPADRDFLTDLLLDGLRRLCAASRRRMALGLTDLVGEISRELTPALEAPDLAGLRLPAAEDLERLLEQQLALLDQQVYTRYQAYARGYLQGGRVDRFLQDRLPRLKLDPGTVEAALWEDHVDLDEELLQPLSRWLSEVRQALLATLDRLTLELDLARLELEERYRGPLAGFATRLVAADAPPDRAP